MCEVWEEVVTWGRKMFLIGVNPLGSLGYPHCTSTMPHLVPGLNYTMPKGSGVSYLFLDYYLELFL